MMRVARWTGWVWLLLAFCLWAPGMARAMDVPALQGRVTDLTATLTSEERAALEGKLAALEQAKGSQLAVLLVDSTAPESIEQFSIRVAESWRLGRRGVDDGVLLLVAKADRALRIEVGYGLEGAIPDAVAKRVIEEFILPHFREDRFAMGVEAGVDRLIGLIQGEPLPPADAQSEEDDSWFPVIMLLALVGGALLRAALGPFLGASLTAGATFIAVWWFVGGWLIALVLAFIIFVSVLSGGRGYRAGGGGGGFSGGGFSGGGGGFGGGGASGRW